MMPLRRTGDGFELRDARRVFWFVVVCGGYEPCILLIPTRVEPYKLDLFLLAMYNTDSDEARQEIFLVVFPC